MENTNLLTNLFSGLTLFNYIQIGFVLTVTICLFMFGILLLKKLDEINNEIVQIKKSIPEILTYLSKINPLVSNITDNVNSIAIIKDALIEIIKINQNLSNLSNQLSNLFQNLNKTDNTQKNKII